MMSERKTLKRTSSIGNGETAIKKAKLSLQTHSHAVDTPNVVLTLGMGDVGQLGHGVDVLQRKKPSIVTRIEDNIQIICAGGMHTICVNLDGQVITFGCNDDGALGRDTTDEGSETVPGFVPIEGTVLQVSAGDSHSAALLDDGRVFAWGSFRELNGNKWFTEAFHGNGPRNSVVQKVPRELMAGEAIVKIASGAHHIVMLSKDGQVFTCGCGEQGQLGRVPEPGTKRVCFNTRSKKIDDIWASTEATLVKTSEDEIYVFGSNNYNQLGLADRNCYYFPVLSSAFSGKKWVQICGGDHHTIARDNEGKVYSLGRFHYGRLGLGPDSGDATAPTVIPQLEDKKCVDVACGSAVSLAVTEEGEVYGWGAGTNAQLGNGEDMPDIFEPTLIGGKQLESRSGLRVSAGGQHTVVLASGIAEVAEL